MPKGLINVHYLSLGVATVNMNGGKAHLHIQVYRHNASASNAVGIRGYLLPWVLYPWLSVGIRGHPWVSFSVGISVGIFSHRGYFRGHPWVSVGIRGHPWPSPWVSLIRTHFCRGYFNVN